MEERKYTYAEGYEYGSAVRKLRPQWEQQENPRPQIVDHPQQAPQKKTLVGADIFAMMLLVATISMTLYMCISYLRVQSDITQLNKAITAMEKEIASVSKENDAVAAVLENEITDMEYIYQMAVGVLGMVYPNNNEVVYYEQQDKGYFRQYQDLPEK